MRLLKVRKRIPRKRKARSLEKPLQAPSARHQAQSSCMGLQQVREIRHHCSVHDAPGLDTQL